MFFEEIKIGFREFEQLVATNDATRIEDYIHQYVKRKFYIGDTGINRKTLLDWEKAGLLPYEYKEEGWRKFSFLEWVWLECIIEFRKLGVSIDKIREIKQMLFIKDPDEWIKFMKSTLEANHGKQEHRDKFIDGFNDQEMIKEIKSQFNEIQISIFLFLVIGVVTTQENYCLVYNNDYCSIFILGNTQKEIRVANQEVMSRLENESFLVVNLRKVVNKIFQKPELRHNDDFILDFLSNREKKIIDEIRGTNAKEIIITFDKKNVPTHIKVNRNRISNETLNKVARYLKKGSFQSVSFRTRDGQLISYDETDIIKI